MNTIKNKHGLRSLFPFLFFAIFYLSLSLWCGDFYRVPMTVAFIAASAIAISMHHPRLLNQNISIFAKGMGNENIMLMCLIFILAGAFAAVAKGMGAVDATVNIAGRFIPHTLMLPGIFLVSCFISLAVGTSCGTIAAVTPIAISMTQKLGISPEIMLGCVIGGAMFGDNISMISDTTIAATRSLNISMRDKFLTNISFVIPAAVVTVITYLCFKTNNTDVSTLFSAAASAKELLKTTPYLLILLLAVIGINVFVLLFAASVISIFLGVLLGAFKFMDALTIMGKGSLDMAETLIVALLAGGMLAVVKHYGGIAWIMLKIENTVKNSKSCEIGTAILVSMINLFTANNTVSIVIAGPIARELALKYKCCPKRIASILDTASCIVQGVIPYGAQMLIATGIANSNGVKISAAKLILHSHYQQILCVAFFIWIIFQSRSRQQKND